MTQATGVGDRALDSFRCWVSGGVQDLGEPVVGELLLRDGDGTAIDWKLQARFRVGEQLKPYSFRHRYAKQMHAANVPIAIISEAMGHTIDVHLKSYARFKPNAKAGIVAAVND